MRLFVRATGEDASAAPTITTTTTVGAQTFETNHTVDKDENENDNKNCCTPLSPNAASATTTTTETTSDATTTTIASSQSTIVLNVGSPSSSSPSSSSSLFSPSSSSSLSSPVPKLAPVSKRPSVHGIFRKAGKNNKENCQHENEEEEEARVRPPPPPRPPPSRAPRHKDAFPLPQPPLSSPFLVSSSPATTTNTTTNTRNKNGQSLVTTMTTTTTRENGSQQPPCSPLVPEQKQQQHGSMMRTMVNILQQPSVVGGSGGVSDGGDSLQNDHNDDDHDYDDHDGDEEKSFWHLTQTETGPLLIPFRHHRHTHSSPTATASVTPSHSRSSSGSTETTAGRDENTIPRRTRSPRPPLNPGQDDDENNHHHDDDATDRADPQRSAVRAMELWQLLEEKVRSGVFLLQRNSTIGTATTAAVSAVSSASPQQQPSQYHPALAAKAAPPMLTTPWERSGLGGGSWDGTTAVQEQQPFERTSSDRTGELREQVQESIRNGIEFTIWQCLGLFLLFMVVGVVAFSFLFDHWTWIDAMYFAVVTCTTVGYGDLVPDSFGGRLFTCIYALSGVCFLGIALGVLGNRVIEAQEAAVEQTSTAAKKRLLNLFSSTTTNNDKYTSSSSSLVSVSSLVSSSSSSSNAIGSSQVDEEEDEEERIAEEMQEEKERQNRNPFWRLLWHFLLIMMLSTFFAFAMDQDSGDGATNTGRRQSDLLDALYFTIVTATTVGYGDYCPVTQRGRLMAIVFIPLAVGAMGHFLSSVANAIMERRVSLVQQQLASRELTLYDLEIMDADGDGHVSRAEFLEFMLVAMNKVDKEFIEELRHHFAQLDVDGTGVLSKDDLIEHARRKLGRIQRKLELAAYKQHLLRQAAAQRRARQGGGRHARRSSHLWYHHDDDDEPIRHFSSWSSAAFNVVAHAPAHFRQATSSLVMGASFAALSLHRISLQSQSSSSQSLPVPQQEQQQQPQFRQYYGSTTVSNVTNAKSARRLMVHCQDNDDNNNNNNAGQSSRVGGGGWSFLSSWSTRTMQEEDITAATFADTSIA